MSNIVINRRGNKLTYQSIAFPAGEIGVKLNLKNSTAYAAKTGFFEPYKYQTIIAKLKSPTDVLELLMVVDALRRVDDVPINLYLPYCPYGRQDRVCDLGEAFSLRVFANLINAQYFNKVIIADPHSNVTGALFNNLHIITQKQIINTDEAFLTRICAGNILFLSPDAGANSKTSEIAKLFNHNEFIRADKKRNLATGEILETVVYCDDLNKQDICIVDDICDGGRTFLECVKVLRTKNVGKIVLYVTHGVFSKGVDVLFGEAGSPLIDEIFTTDSYHDSYGPRVKTNYISDAEYLTFARVY